MTNEERTIQSKNKIIDLIMIEFADKGYDGISISQFCAKNNISKGRMYHHFLGKDQLFFCCAEKCYQELVQILLTFEPNCNDSYEKNLHNYFKLRQNYFVNHPHRALVMYQVVQTTPPSIKQSLKSLRSGCQSTNGIVIRKILSSIPPQSNIDTDIMIETFELASNYVNIVHGFANWNTSIDMTDVAQGTLEFFDNVMQILLYGVLPRNSAENYVLK